MNEWIASFIGCLIGMGYIRLIDSICHNSSYWRGYRDGSREVIEAYKKYGTKTEEESE